VRLVERVADVDGDLQGLVRIERAATGQAFGDGLAFEIFQDEEVDAVLMSDVEQRADVRMIERREIARASRSKRSRICGSAASSAGITPE
jgi:hypothetical protein